MISWLKELFLKCSHLYLLFLLSLVKFPCRLSCSHILFLSNRNPGWESIRMDGKGMEGIQLENIRPESETEMLDLIAKRRQLRKNKRESIFESLKLSSCIQNRQIVFSYSHSSMKNLHMSQAIDG